MSMIMLGNFTFRTVRIDNLEMNERLWLLITLSNLILWRRFLHIFVDSIHRLSLLFNLILISNTKRLSKWVLLVAFSRIRPRYLWLGPAVHAINLCIVPLTVCIIIVNFTNTNWLLWSTKRCNSIIIAIINAPWRTLFIGGESFLLCIHLWVLTRVCHLA